ncbi:MAG: DUF4038 domain-containing protein [Bryobacteraceae bacterium]
MQSLLLLAALAAVDRYGHFEQSFTAARDYDNPLAQEFRVRFTGPGGAGGEARAFWDGGRTWKVRFMPDRAGPWSYRVACEAASDAGLCGRSGSFRVNGYRGANPLYRHGPLRLSKNRRYLEYGDGTPWFWLADTAWNGALLSTPREWTRYVARRAAQRFTAIQFVTTQWRAGRQDERGQAAFTGRERIAVNPAFYQRLDTKFDELNAQGLVALPVLLWALTSKDNESPGAALPEDQAILLSRYMVARYGAHHVVWILGGDGNYRGERAARWKTIGRAVFGGEPHAPVTMHPGGMQDPWPEFKDEPWLDILMYQSGHGADEKKWRWNATQGPAAGWKLEPPRPVIDGEINYEGHLNYQFRQRISDYDVRRAAYYSLLSAPPAGVTYGAHGVWPWLRERGVPLDHPRTGEGEPWFQSIEYPGARQMKVLREVFESLEWWKLRPDRTLLAADPDDIRAYAMPARADRFALIYFPTGPLARVNTQGFSRAVWIDPRTGARHRASIAREMRMPDEGDWLLLLQKR